MRARLGVSHSHTRKVQGKYKCTGSSSSSSRHPGTHGLIPAAVLRFSIDSVALVTQVVASGTCAGPVTCGGLVPVVWPEISTCATGPGVLTSPV